MYFIFDRVETLSFEAIRFPETAKTALAYLWRAFAWAERRGFDRLAGFIGAHIAHVTERRGAA